MLLRGAASLGVAALLPETTTACAIYASPAPYASFTAPANGLLVVHVDQYPDLSKDGGAITARIDGFPFPLLIAHPGGAGFFCTASTCTHKGCPLGFDGTHALCPCHGSLFDENGGVLRPPATVPLMAFKTTFFPDGNKLVVDLAGSLLPLPAASNGVVTLPLTDFPQLATPGGTVLGAPAGTTTALLVVATGASFSAVNPLCTHLNCAYVAYSAADGELHCPCHGSVFALDGSVVVGPATTPLPKYAAVEQGQAVLVTLS